MDTALNPLSSHHGQAQPYRYRCGNFVIKIVCRLREDLDHDNGAASHLHLPQPAAIEEFLTPMYEDQYDALSWEEATFLLLNKLRRNTPQQGEHWRAFADAALVQLRRATPYSFLWKH